MLRVKKLCISYEGIPIVKDAEFEVKEKEIIGIVGESGCGKSTLLQSLLMLEKKAVIDSGEVIFRDRRLGDLSEEEIRCIRGNEIAVVFQNAALSMDPMKTIGNLFYETVRMHSRITKKECEKRAKDLMKKVRLADVDRIWKSYPFELSGGMCQRIAIAAAMMNQPSLILADEPTSALDVTAQAQVVALMQYLREEFGTSMIVVSHNMGVIAQLADKIAVMYSGNIVEWGTAGEVLHSPGHPYTKALINAIPRMDGSIPKGIAGRPPEFSEKRTGCPFAPRCGKRTAVCSGRPEKIFLSEEHWIACRHMDKI